MIQSIIAALVSLFFWSKSTKDVEEKTEHSSWPRTGVYFAFALAVLAFYLKTNEVAHVVHDIQMMGVRETRDSTGNNVDDIQQIYIYNKFSSGITENTRIRKTETVDEKIKKIAEIGGFLMIQNVRNGKQYKHETSENFKKACLENNKFNTKYEWGGIPVDNYTHAYQLSHSTMVIPSLIPISPRINIDKTEAIPNFSPYKKIIISDIDSYDYGKFTYQSVEDTKGYTNVITKEVNKAPFEAYVHTQIMTDTITSEEDFQYIFSYEDNFSNRMNFFTAADVSQYTFSLRINSDCHVDELRMIYDLPIEINSYNDSDMIIRTTNFVLKDDYLNDEIINNGPYAFHVKFPTLANLQLIRSLILTTLLTALVSLFFLNLFYRIRKHAIEFKEKHITQISEVKVKSFKLKMLILLYLFLALIVYLAYRIFYDKPFHMNIELYDWMHVYYMRIILGGVFILLVFIYFLFRKAYTIEKTKSKK